MVTIVIAIPALDHLKGEYTAQGGSCNQCNQCLSEMSFKRILSRRLVCTHGKDTVTGDTAHETCKLSSGYAFGRTV